MSTTDTDALTECIARAMATQDGFGPEHPDHEIVTGEWSSAAAAVLPIVESEVRKAKAEALREAALQYGPGQLTGMFSRDGYTRAWLNARATEYETGDSDEHR